MEDREEIRVATSTVQEHAANARICHAGLVDCVLRWLFDRLSIETRLWLSFEVLAQATAAHMTVREAWGDQASTRVDGNELRVYVAGVLVGYGPTWPKALTMARNTMASGAVKVESLEDPDAP